MSKAIGNSVYDSKTERVPAIVSNLAEISLSQKQNQSQNNENIINKNPVAIG